MEARRAAADGREWRPVRRGWCLGRPEFRAELLGEMREQTGPNHAGEERREAAAAWAGQRLAKELRRLGWTAPELGRRRKGDPQKVELARRLRRETTVTLGWLAEKLCMGTAGSLANLLRTSK
jgi:hypothetical protein